MLLLYIYYHTLHMYVCYYYISTIASIHSCYYIHIIYDVHSTCSVSKKPDSPTSPSDAMGTYSANNGLIVYTHKDYLTVSPGGYDNSEQLNDILVDIGVQNVYNKCQVALAESGTVVTSVLFFQKIESTHKLSTSSVVDYSDMNNWCENDVVSFNGATIVLIPYYADAHYTLIILFKHGPQSYTIYSLDSMTGNGSSESPHHLSKTAPLLVSFLTHRAGSSISGPINYTAVAIEGPQQHNGHDCGMFVIKGIEAFAEGVAAGMSLHDTILSIEAANVGDRRSEWQACMPEERAKLRRLLKANAFPSPLTADSLVDGSDDRSVSIGDMAVKSSLSTRKGSAVQMLEKYVGLIANMFGSMESFREKVPNVKVQNALFTQFTKGEDLLLSFDKRLEFQLGFVDGVLVILQKFTFNSLINRPSGVYYDVIPFSYTRFPKLYWYFVFSATLYNNQLWLAGTPLYGKDCGNRYIIFMIVCTTCSNPRREFIAVDTSKCFESGDQVVSSVTFTFLSDEDIRTQGLYPQPGYKYAISELNDPKFWCAAFKVFGTARGIIYDPERGLNRTYQPQGPLGLAASAASAADKHDLDHGLMRLMR